MDGAKIVRKAFLDRFGSDLSDVRVFKAAGRVNIIGEHIDYCGGKVLPAALSVGCFVAARKKTDGSTTITVAATTLADVAEIEIDSLENYKKAKWGSYQAGVAYILRQAGFDIVPCTLLFHCDIPFGAGLSSSAAIEVATALTLSTFSKEAGGKSADKKELAILARRAECEYVGVNCGIMDQFASAMGKAGHAIYLDCATLDYEYIPLDLGNEFCLLVINSNKRRSLIESKYNERWKECEEALQILKQSMPKISQLAEVTKQQFEIYKDTFSNKTVARRAEHVILECGRVNESVAALKCGDIEALGKFLNESHFSLRDNYEVTGFELDTLTDLARSHEKCVGARMTGAGFGGCAVAIVKREGLDSFKAEVSSRYEKICGYKADFIDVEICDGAAEII